MKKFRPAIGILMIILAIGSMFYWESYGRERFFTEEALYAKHEIKKGELINAGMLKAGRISHENLVQGAVGMNEIKDVVGKIAEFNIPENCQLSKSMFSKRDFFIGKGRAIFVIPQEWIYMRSSSLRKGDKIDIYSLSQRAKIGKFSVAFVKDNVDREITDLNGTKKELLNRDSTSGVIDHIEIICNEDVYSKIRALCQINPKDLLIIQGGNN